MYDFFDFQFWLYFLYTYLAVGISIVLPGYFLLSKYSFKSPLVRMVIAVSVGLVIWTLQAYVFGYLGIRFATYVYVGLVLLFTVINNRKVWSGFTRLIGELKRFDRVALSLIIVGSLVQVFPLFGSGIRYEDGIRFFHVNATDGVLHLGYIQSMVKSFPPIEPGISAPLVNYHYWSDLAISELVRIWKLPTVHLFFQYIPPFIAIVTGFAVYLLAKVWSGSKNVSRWALFLLFFAGDAAYFIIIVLHQYLTFRSPALDNGALQFLNMPHVFAKMIFITALIPIHTYFKTTEKKWGLLSILLVATLVGYKVYFGIFVAIGLSFYLLYRFVQTLRQWRRKSSVDAKSFIFEVGLLCSFALISAFIYFPPNKSSGGLVLAPLAWSRIFFGVGSFNFDGFILKRDIYYESKNYVMGVVFDVIIYSATLIAVYGTRIIGFFSVVSAYRKIGLKMIIFLVPGILIFTTLGLFTLQTSGLYNVYNFFAVSAVILSLFTAFMLADIQKKKNIFATVFLILFILFTIPRSLYEIYNFYSLYVKADQSAKTVSNKELEGLMYVRENADDGSIIQTHPNNAWDHDAPYAIYFTDTTSYLTGAGLLRTHNQPVDEKAEILTDIFDTDSPDVFADFLITNNIDYVILQNTENQKLKFNPNAEPMNVVFENEAVTIIEPMKE